MLIDALEDAGFSVIEASTADEALGILNDQSIHLLFTDIQMPGKMPGLDLAHVVADQFPQAGILIASGRLTLADIELPPSAQFFAKPYNLDEVMDRLGQLSPNPMRRNEWRSSGLSSHALAGCAYQPATSQSLN